MAVSQSSTPVVFIEKRSHRDYNSSCRKDGDSMRKRIDAANEFVENLITARNMDEQSGAVYQILSSGQTKGLEAHGEDAKAFLVHLAIDTFGIDYRSDIVLCSWGLLRGYDRIQSVTERRIKFITESNFQSKKASLKTKENTGSFRSLEDRSKDLIDLEKKLYTKIDEKYTKYVTDKRSFLQTAKQRYLVRTAGLNGSHQVRLPKPSYLRGDPMPMNNLPQRKPFIGREDILGVLEEAFAADSRIQLLVGMGGVGKTRIALEYAYKHAIDYEAIAWIDAQNALSIHKSCIEFLERVESAAVTDNTEAIRERFVSFFNQSSDWLIIYDNVDYLNEDSEKASQMQTALERYLPSSNGDILITTRCNKPFLGVDGIPVSVFSPKLAVRYLEIQTKQKADDAANLLANRLGYLPLALAYAAAYIKANHKTYQQYLDLWSSEGTVLFDEDILETTVRKAFHITLDKLSEKAQGTSVILQFLHFCAILAGEYIPIDFFNIDFNRRSTFDVFPEELSAILHSDLKRDRILRKASEYSLVDYVDSRCIFMHPMLREIIEDELRLDAENTADNERRIEALTWKRVGYYAKSELAHAYYERGDVIAANRQMYSAIPDFLELEKEMLQLQNRLLDQRSYESQGYKHTWCDIRREFDLIYWRTMDFADENLEKKMYNVRKRLMLSYYQIWSEWVSQPDAEDYMFLIKLKERGKDIDADSAAPLILNYAIRERGSTFRHDVPAESDGKFELPEL